MFTKPCPVCGGTISHKWPSDLARLKTCSRSCAMKANPYRGAHKKRPLRARFFDLVKKHDGDGCWLWLGTCRGDGYGLTKTEDRKTIGSHRMAYLLTYGEIPDGLLVLHKCDNPPCVNPEHLFLGTHQDNRDDMLKKGRNRGN